MDHKGRKLKGRPPTSLTELVAAAEHFERTLGPDRKQKYAKLLAFWPQQIQGLALKITPGPPTLRPPRDPLLKLWPRDLSLNCNQLRH